MISSAHSLLMSRPFGLGTSTVAVAGVLLGLAACVGGGSSASRPQARQLAWVRRAPAVAAASCAPCIYVANEALGGEGSVTAYPLSAGGNVAWSRAIQGAKTGLGVASGVALDASGNIYVASGGANAVLVYAAASRGNAPAAEAIRGSKTRLDHPSGVALDGGSNIFVANAGHGDSPRPSVTVFAAGADGDVAPIRTISGSNTGLNSPSAVTFGPLGNLYVADRAARAILIFAPSSNGNVAPIRTISGEHTLMYEPSAIALDSAGELYVANYAVSPTGSVTVYAPGLSGNIAPIRSIYGPNTGIDLPTGIALDPSDNVYVANRDSEVGRGKLTAYTAGASGDVAPIQTILGSKTGLNRPSGIAIR
jgi:hypothetical protein